MTGNDRPGEDRLSDDFVVADEQFAQVDGAPEFGLRPTETDGFPEAHVTVHRTTGVAAWGATRDEAIEHVQCDARRYVEADRPGEIVETDGVLGGDPRVAGSRIGVLHVVDRFDATGSVVETAAGFSGVLSVEEVRTALEWADANPETIQHLRAERARVIEDIRTGWERVPLDDESDTVVYRRPHGHSATFAILDDDTGEADGER